MKKNLGVIFWTDFRCSILTCSIFRSHSTHDQTIYRNATPVNHYLDLQRRWLSSFLWMQHYSKIIVLLSLTRCSSSDAKQNCWLWKYILFFFASVENFPVYNSNRQLIVPWILLQFCGSKNQFSVKGRYYSITSAQLWGNDYEHELAMKFCCWSWLKEICLTLFLTFSFGAKILCPTCMKI